MNYKFDHSFNEFIKEEFYNYARVLFEKMDPSLQMYNGFNTALDNEKFLLDSVYVGLT